MRNCYPFVNNYSNVSLFCNYVPVLNTSSFHDKKMEDGVCGLPGTLSQPNHYQPRVKDGPAECHARAAHSDPGSHQPQYLGGGKCSGVDQWTKGWVCCYQSRPLSPECRVEAMEIVAHIITSHLTSIDTQFLCPCKAQSRSAWMPHHPTLILTVTRDHAGVNQKVLGTMIASSDQLDRNKTIKCVTYTWTRHPQGSSTISGRILLTDSASTTL